MKVYLDNAATTPIDPRVFEAMEPYLRDFYGKPSSSHSHGREARSAVEKSRKTIAEILNTTPGEIFFTSSGTEADNTFLTNQVRHNNIRTIITSPIEHHAVLDVAEALKKTDDVTLKILDLDSSGEIDYEQVEELIRESDAPLVSLMEANNEIGNLIDIQRVSTICNEFGAVFHSDTVQTLGYLEHRLSESSIDCIVGTAHKFHGPKGTGIMYLKKGTKLQPFILGGGQERSMRAGTENVYGIVGFAKALELAHEDRGRKYAGLIEKKELMIHLLKDQIPQIEFNGYSGNTEKSLATVLSLRLPQNEVSDMLLFQLDLKGISTSGGSACNSGASVGSHVIAALGVNPSDAIIRFSISRMTSEEEIRYAVKSLAEVYTANQTT